MFIKALFSTATRFLSHPSGPHSKSSHEGHSWLSQPEVQGIKPQPHFSLARHPPPLRRCHPTCPGVTPCMAAAQSHAEGSLAGQRGAHGTSAAQGGLRLRFGQKNWKRQTTESDDGLLDPRWHKASSPASTCARGRGGRGWGGSLGGPAREGPRPGPIPSRPAGAGLLGAVPAAGGSKARCVSRCRRRGLCLPRLRPGRPRLPTACAPGTGRERERQRGGLLRDGDRNVLHSSV